MKIGIGLSFYQCVDELKRLLPTIQGVDVIYAIDGRHDVYNAENDLSDDGSREYVKSFDNVKLFDMGGVKQVTKRCKYCIEAGKDDCDFILVMDSDMWCMGSWTMFRKHLDRMVRRKPHQTRFWMPHYREIPNTKFIITDIARVLKHPMFWRYHIRHSNLTFMGKIRRASKTSDDTVFGICTRTNKDLRKEFRRYEGQEAKIRNNRNESALAKQSPDYPNI